MLRLQRGLWQAAALAVLAHAAVLTQLPGLRPAAPWGQGGPTIHPFRMRVIPLPAPAEPASLAPAPEVPALAVQPEVPAREPAPARPAAAPSLAAVAPAAGAPTGSPSLDEAPYLTRDRLTVAPQPLTSVDVAFPQDVAGIVDLRIKVTLFIDEQGVVRRVQLDSPDIPPAFARAVIDTFSSTRFSPGKVEAAAVRSRIRMEIEFRAPGTRLPEAAGGLGAPVKRGAPASVLAPS